MKINGKLSSLLAVGLCALALASCNFKFFSDKPDQETPSSARVEYNSSLDRWEAYDASNTFIWYEKRYTASGKAIVEHYTAAGLASWKSTDADSGIAGGGNRHTYIYYLPGATAGAWKQDSKIVDDSSVPLAGQQPGGAVLRNVRWNYNGLDLLQSYSVSDFDANGHAAGLYDFSGTNQLLGARLFDRSSQESYKVVGYYDANGALTAYQQIFYDAEDRWTSVLPYGGDDKLIQPQTGELPVAQLWTWPAGATQEDRENPPQDWEGWSSHVVLALDSANQTFSVDSAELRAYDAQGRRTSTTYYSGSSLSEQYLAEYDGSGEISRQSRWLPPDGAAVTGTIAVHLPGWSASRALRAAVPSPAGIALPDLVLPLPPAPPSQSLALTDLAVEEKSFTLWYRDARGTLESSFDDPAFPTRTVFSPAADPTNAYGLLQLDGKDLILSMGYDEQLRPTSQSLEWNEKVRYSLGQQYNATGLLSQLDIQGELAVGTGTIPLHLFVTATYRSDYTPSELQLWMAGSGGAADLLLFTLQVVYSNAPINLASLPGWTPSVDPIWFGAKVKDDLAGVSVTELRLLEGASQQLKGRYTPTYNFDGNGSTKIDVIGVDKDGVDGARTAQLVFRHNASGKTVGLEAYAANAQGALGAKPDWKYAYDYASIQSSVQPAVQQVVAKRKFSADGAMDLYDALDTSSLLQSLLANLGF